MKQISAQKVRRFMTQVLEKEGVRKDVGHALVEGLLHASLRGVDSHGIGLFPHYVSGVKQGRINKNPNYTFKKTAPSTGMLDADHTFGHAAGIEGAKHAVQLAESAGMGAISIYNSSHFGAASYYGLEIAAHNMIGFSFTNTDALIQTFNGKKPFLGNNPICVAVPCEGEEPFCLDMATSTITFNKVRLHREEGRPLPEGVASDKEGKATTDPDQAAMLSPMGSYKGYGLSMVIEILCSLLSGMPFGPHIPKMFEAPLTEKRYLGHFLMALNIESFQPLDNFKKRMSLFLNEIRREPRKNPDVPIQVSGDPQKAEQKIRIREGIPVPALVIDKFQTLSQIYQVEFLKEVS